MCNSDKKAKTLQQIVKETIDAVYEYLAPHPDGITMVVREYGTKGSRVISSLVNRGIITKERVGKNEYRYRWIATMAPTSVLYGSVSDEIRAIERGYQKAFRERKAAAKARQKPDKTYPLSVITEELGSTPQPPVVLSPDEKPVAKSPLEEIQEMWERMKELGATIEDNRIVLIEIKKTVLS